MRTASAMSSFDASAKAIEDADKLLIEADKLASLLERSHGRLDSVDEWPATIN